MHTCTLTAPAKINFYIEIIGDRPDGFHELAMVMQSIELADQVTLQLHPNSSSGIQVHCDHPLVPADGSNLAYRAAALMRETFPEAFSQFGSVQITIDKQIPVGAGLAGGSTDAAAVLVGLDLLWHLGLTQMELRTLGAQIGSDIPFCIAGGTALATGRGEQISPLSGFGSLYLVLAKYRQLSVSTAWAYQTYRQKFSATYISDAEAIVSRHSQLHAAPLIAALMQQDGAALGQHLHNDLEKVVLPAHPEVEKLKTAFTALAPLGVLMSGSGPTVFALAQSADDAERIAQGVREAIDDPTLELWVTCCSPAGVQLALSN
ncbi:MAG: 4-(cytidine 5'-diphospho)-2-C-methyl-D-erythritol kinase [Elainellaceae cyanobacterium]